MHLDTSDLEYLSVQLPHLCTECLHNNGCSCCPAPCQSIESEISTLQKILAIIHDSTKSSTDRAPPDILRLGMASLVAHRISDSQFMTSSHNYNHAYLCLAMLRVSIRYARILDDSKTFTPCFVKHLTRLGEQYSELYVDSAFHSQKTLDKLLYESAAILLKLAQSDVTASMVMDHAEDICALCIVVIPSNKQQIIGCCLQILLILTSNLDTGRCEGVATLNVIEPLSELLSSPHHASLHKAAVDIILNLASLQAAKPPLTHQIRMLDFMPVMFSKMLSRTSVSVARSSAWVVAKLCSDPEVCSQLLNSGSVPLMLNFIHSSVSDPFPSVEVTGHSDPLSKSMNDLQLLYSIQSAFCFSLSRIAFPDSTDWILIDSNAIFIIGSMVFQSTNHQPHNQELDGVREERTAAGLLVLRLLYSKEKYKDTIKSFFPPHLMPQFVDIGNYNLEFPHYSELARTVIAGMPYPDVPEKLLKISSIHVPSKFIGPYTVVNSLGAGSFGSVFKVRKQGSENFYAIKKIVVSSNDPSSKRKTLASTVNNEINILREKLDHPNVVKYLKSFSENDSLYVVMEFVDGVSLQQHLDFVINTKAFPIEEDWIWNLGLQLVSALYYLHIERNLVHRDLSPNNILIAFDNTVKITDFGFTKPTENGVLTSVVGTVVYWCPEIIQNTPYDGRADIWAFGCVLYQTCTLNPPFYGTNMLSIARKVVEGSYEPIESDCYSQLLLDLISRCITSDSNERPDAKSVVALVSEKLIKKVDLQTNSLKTAHRKMSRQPQQSKYSADMSRGSSPTWVKSGSCSSLGSELGISPTRVNSGSMLRVPSCKLREVQSDPVVDTLILLRKIDQVCNRPIDKRINTERSVVQILRRHLYECNDASWMKGELHRLLSHSDDPIPLFSSQSSRNYSHLVQQLLLALQSDQDISDVIMMPQTTPDELTYRVFMITLNKCLSTPANT